MKSTRCPRFNFNRQDVQLGERALFEILLEKQKINLHDGLGRLLASTQVVY
jgi:hypothetical protein